MKTLDRASPSHSSSSSYWNNLSPIRSVVRKRPDKHVNSVEHSTLFMLCATRNYVHIFRHFFPPVSVWIPSVISRGVNSSTNLYIFLNAFCFITLTHFLTQYDNLKSIIDLTPQRYASLLFIVTRYRTWHLGLGICKYIRIFAHCT